jgi:hypothetical protein
MAPLTDEIVGHAVAVGVAKTKFTSESASPGFCLGHEREDRAPPLDLVNRFLIGFCLLGDQLKVGDTDSNRSVNITDSDSFWETRCFQ